MVLSVRRLLRSIDYRLVQPIFGSGNRKWETKTDFRKTHNRQFRDLRASHSIEETAEIVVGGQFEAVGQLLRDTVIHFGLRPTDYLIDVGCGSGRLAKPLSEYLTGKYLGIDVVPELLNYARKLVARPDWRFEAAAGLTIPERDETADMVCFFSVLTHLLHEESYLYLKEARRVLKPGGKIVASFLDFEVDEHWLVFENNLKDVGVGAAPLNVFMSVGLLRQFAKHLELEIEVIKNGDEKHIPLSKPVTSSDSVEDLAASGQSVCVMRKR